MTPHDLLKHLDVIAEAPNGIARLRELVLQLAVRGKLVPQDPEDEPAAAQLNRARVAMVQQVSSGAFRTRWAPSEDVSPADVAFDLPPGWTWARVNDTGLYINGLAFKPSQWGASGLPIIRIQNLTDPAKEFNRAEGEFPEEVVVRDGDILVSWSATLEAFVWKRGRGVLNQHIFRVLPCSALVTSPFLYWLLRHAIRDMAESDHAHGLAMKHINRGPFLAHVVAVPPLSEQARIVARVDELMALLDRLEAARNTREATRRALRDSSLAALRDADTPDDLESAWQRVADHMDDLLTTPEDLPPFRQTMLQLAVRGRLVPQDPKDEPAGQLLRRIDGERGRGPKHPRPEAPEPVQEPYRVPPGWMWCPISALAGHIVDGTHHTPTYADEGIDFLSAKDIKQRQVSFEDCRKIDRAQFDELTKRCKPQRGHVLVTKSGTIGQVAVVETDRPFTLFESVALVPLLGRGEVLPRYIADVVEVQVAGSFGVARTKGAAVKHLHLNDLRQLPVPLPPSAEQLRIVTRLDELGRLLGQLEQRFVRVASDHAHLGAAVVHHLDA